MGSMFKVLAISAPHLTDLAGFKDENDEQAGRQAAAAMTLESPLLSAIPGLRHAFFTREGGVSERHLWQPQRRRSARTTTPPMSPKTAAGWRSRWASTPERLLTLWQIHSPDVVVATGPWHGGTRPHGRRHRHPHRRPRHRRHRGRLRPDPVRRPARAGDRRGACGMEGRADRHPGIHHRGDGKARRRARRHRRRHRPADPPALLRSRRRIRRALHRGRRGQRAVLHSLGDATAIRCSISPASSGCGSKRPACS